MPNNYSDLLRLEATYLYNCLFHQAASENLLAGYVKAHQKIQALRSIQPKQQVGITQIVTRQLDAVGIEFWLRSGEPRHALSCKLLLLIYLAECGGQLSSQLVRGSSTQGYLWWKIALDLGRTGFYTLRGGYQKLRYGLV